MSTPPDLRYTAQHEWVRHDGGRTVRVGITDYAQSQLGDVVYVALPEPGTRVSGGSPVGEVESTKSVSDIYAPVTGVVAGRNEALDDQPQLVNTDPYGAGWMLDIEVADEAGFAALTARLAELLDATAYQNMVEATSSGQSTST